MEPDALRPGQGVGLSHVLLGATEHDGRHLGDVSCIDEGDDTLAGGNVDAVLLHDVAAKGVPEVLGEEAWP